MLEQRTQEIYISKLRAQDLVILWTNKNHAATSGIL